jgi:signal transduction histidine kinase
VRLEDSNGQVSLMVEDDGVGFDQHGGVVYGLGLLGLTERVRELSGNINIESQPGRGTRLAVVLPVNRAEQTPTG